MRILVTGAAGFIGFHLSRRLLNDGHQVLGLDNLNDYYDVTLKTDRLALLQEHDNFSFSRTDIADTADTLHQFEHFGPEIVVNLAAQAGVRYSLKNPHAYVQSNLAGFVNVLEGCRWNGVQHLVYASSSSVYGGNTKMPYAVTDNVDHPVSLYAATKKSNELMAHTYSHLYSLPTTGLRFFTVYGPWGRPDMAYFKFAKAIMEGRAIEVYNHGKMQRDFTYIDDIVEGIVRTLALPAEQRPGGDDTPTGCGDTRNAPYRLFNIGYGAPTDLMDFIALLERALGRSAEKAYLPMQPGDVPVTFADTAGLKEATGYAPTTCLEEGIRRFMEWFRAYYNG